MPDAVFADQDRAGLRLQPLERRDQVFLARASLAMGWIGRLGLARLMGVEKRRHREIAGDEGPGQAVGL